MLDSVDHVIGFGEINLVLISNDLSLGLSLETHLDNISRLIIEKSVGVAQPGNCTEKDTKKYWLENETRRISEMMNNGQKNPAKRNNK
jgi:hypothetical protein